MSMLAEPRRKANWVLNPRNNHWTADNSKFGLRLMEKMGWTEGSGLGANEQGSTEHIKVAVRSDNRGVGFKDRPEDELVHQSEFSDLLQQLASNTPPLEGSGDENKSAVITSLEEKSQKSRSRVHYKKFTRGKDLSRYSEKDLASILGKPAPVKNSTAGDEEKKESTFESDVVTVGGGNMLDYFRKKMASFRSEESSGDASRSEEICEDNSRRELNGVENIAETNGVKKKKKSKRVSKDVDDSTFEAKLEGVKNTDTKTRKERKRRRKAEEALKVSEQEIDTKNSNDVKDENSMNCKLNLSSTSECCAGAEKDSVGGAETKKEKKRRQKAEKALKILEQQAEVENAANLQINVMNRNAVKSKQKIKSASDHRKQDKEDDKIFATDAHANNKKEKKQKQIVEGALENGQGRTEHGITTNSAESSSDQKSNKMLAEDGDKSAERKLKKRKNKTVNEKDNKCVENEMEIIEESNADDLCSKEKKTKMSKKLRKECDQGTIQLDVKNDVNSSKIKNRKRKSEDDENEKVIPGIETKEGKKREGNGEILDNLETNAEYVGQEFKKEKKHKKRKTTQGEQILVNNDVISDSRSAKINTENESQKILCGVTFVGSNEQQNGHQMPIGTEVNKSEDFWDARSKKAKKKGKQHKLPESSEHVLEPLSKCVVDSKKGVGCSVEIQNDTTLERRDWQTSGSKTFENNAEGLSVECSLKEKKEKKRKPKNREALFSEMPEESTCVLGVGVECFVDTKKERKRKKDRDPEENGKMTEKTTMNDGNQGFENIENVVGNANLRPLEEHDDVIEAENIDVVSSVIFHSNVAGTSNTGVDEKGKVLALNRGEQICCTTNTIVIDDVTQNNGSVQGDAAKKPVPIVELNGKVYLNGICNFDLSHPEINNAELKKIPLHLRQDVEFLPIPGANVDEFGYIGLKFHK